MLIEGTGAATLIGSYNTYGTGQTVFTYDVQSLIPDYTSALASDFFAVTRWMRGHSDGNGTIEDTPTFSYNASTGVVTLTGVNWNGGGVSLTMRGNVYYIKGGLPT